MRINYLICPCVQVHDEVLGLGVPVLDLALVTVRVPGHPVRAVPVVSILIQWNFVIVSQLLKEE